MSTVRSPFGIKEVGGYCFATIGDVIDSSVSQKGPTKDFVYLDIGSIDRDSKRFLEHKLVSIGNAPSRAKQVVATGDVLVSMTRPNLNAVAMVEDASSETIASTGFHVLRAHEMDSKFLYYLVQTEEFVRSMCNLVQGALYPAVRPRDILSFEFQLPPRVEQSRIVEKLEELLSDLDEGVAELRKAESKLLSYRQSLLKYALEGHLTTDWRAANGKPKEAGADLLQRILSERRAHWEKKQLAKFKEQGKAPPKNWQAKYPVPLVPDVTDLPALPEGWAWTSLDTLIEDGPQNGLYLSSDHYGRGTEILRIDDYQTGWYREREALNRVEADASTLTTYALKLGDIVINRVNSVTHLGKCLRVPASLSGVLFESNMMRLRLTEAASTNFVAFYLGSANGRLRLIRDAKWAVNQASINQQDVRRTPIPLPSIKEQIVIADLLDFHQTAIDAQLAAIDSSLKRVAVQRKVLLKAAFTGQLVPQDPNDEPASELLARIRAARDSKAGGSIASKRGRKPKVAP